MTKPRKPKENFLDTDLSQQTSTATQEPQQVDADDQELDEVFAEFPQNEACIELFRTTDKGGKPAFLEDLSPSDFSFGYVCRNYGGGKYKAKGKYKDGSTVNRSFEIEGPPFPIKRKIPQGSPEPGANPAPTVQPIEIVRTESGAPDMVATMMALMKTMVLELRTSETEMLAKMKMYKDLFGAEKPQAPPLEQALTMFQRGVEMAGMAGGDGGNSSIWMMALRELKEPLTDIVATIKHAVTQRQPIAVNSAQPITGPQAERPVKPVEEREGMEAILLGALRQMLPMLVTGAAQGAEDGEAFYCDFLLDQIPAQYYATAKIWLEKPGCLDQLEKMNIGVKAYRGWFERLQIELLKALNERLAGDATRTLQPEPTSDATADRSADL